jgi:Protein of unknown function (DUF1176)
MRYIFHYTMFLASALLSPVTGAQNRSTDTGDGTAAQGLYFQHKDWELACDNTGTCRAAGYSAEDTVSSPASVLLVRAAGAGTPVKINFKALTEADSDDAQGKFTVRISGSNFGPFKFGEDLTQAQVKSLLPKIFSGQKIELLQGAQRWQISLAGLNAVALKMDETQRRISTANALTASSRGTKDESNVAQPIPIRTIIVSKLPPQNGIDKRLIDQIKAALPKIDCSARAESINIEALNDKQVLVEVNPCERAAYNEENAYFIASIKAPHSPKRIMFDNPANEYSLGVIAGFYKGRGIGDCVSRAEYAWDGVRFVKANVSGSGMCRGFLGGAWDMSTVVSKINNPNLAPRQKISSPANTKMR